jgi:hypothetical protein
VSITSYRELDAENQRDFDATPLVIATFYDLFEQWQASQEAAAQGLVVRRPSRLDRRCVLFQGEGR